MIFEKVAAIVAEQFGVDVKSITKETTFDGGLGADSLDIVELSMALDEEFGVEELSEEALSGITTVGDVVRQLQNHLD